LFSFLFILWWSLDGSPHPVVVVGLSSPFAHCGCFLSPIRAAAVCDYW